MRARTLVAVIVVAGAACVENEPAPPPPERTPAKAPARAPATAAAVPDEPSGPDPSIDWLPRIEDEATWRLAAPSDEHAVARTDVVKLVVDLEDGADGAFYFCQSGRWPIHYDFAVRFLEREGAPLGDRRTFNTRNYLRDDRRFLMASLVHYVEPDLYTLELGPADNLAGARIARLVRSLRGKVFFADRLRYRPRSETHQRAINGVRDLPTIGADEVWAGVRYQPLTFGRAIGHLRIVRGELDPATVEPTHLLVTAGVPDDMPLCAGLVTSELQTPLSHVAVLSAGRGTPNMALRGAADEARFRELDGELVALDVRPQGFHLRVATPEEAEAAWAARRPTAAPVAITVNRGPAELRPIRALRATDVAWAGAKAAQLGEVDGLGIETPGGFVVPAYHYLSHLRQHDVEPGVGSLAKAVGWRANLVIRQRRLAERRRLIATGTVDANLVRAVRARLDPERRHIFRSSTNAEDLEGFTGAGLYESVVVDAGADDAAVARALAEVWASVWTLRAFEEREWYRIPHEQVAMAILVQPFLDEVVALGVAITENPFSTRRSGMLVNLQSRGGSVTATTDELPEQVLLYRHSQPEILSRSTRTGGQAILRPEEMTPLRDLLQRIHDHFAPRFHGGANAVDVELALMSEPRRFVILQARPYTVRPRDR